MSYKIEKGPNVHYITFFRLSNNSFTDVVHGSNPIDIYQEESSKDWSQIWRVDYGQWDLESEEIVLSQGEMIMNITQLSQNDKAIFAIRLAEKANSYLQADNQDKVEEALSLCWKWIETKSDLGEELYLLLDNEDNGFTLLQEDEEDDVRISAWDCIIDAIAIVSRMAYEEMGQKFFPEAIELVDDSTFSHMISSLTSCNDTEADYIASVYDAYLKGQGDITTPH